VRLTLRAAAEPAVEPAAVDRQGLLEALHELPEDARAVLVCRYLLDLSEQETAAALDVAPGTVKSRTSRALERLRELYG
jgi:RNA polymerase sigma-70 factor, ECF subfamily